ncbi:glucose dehydrogenase [FAD, quinone]-like [Argiope bruennichi]|uniref:Glucose dehydrogenase like protein n=1 Tax=Argiope bruennichi TaxID=94029 RepID=A0A8T0ETS2_ARGBR|nr:glucose dehydrogenase [FAD, quinone]-like [Argiope bruennichi]KAF8781705.1 Glucose dehydrogenase like protein [Argiope bruennichi]
MECDLHISNPGILDTLNIPYERSFPTPYANSPLLPLLILSLLRQRVAPKLSPTIRSEYDYIVVGSGAGGSTVAGRLSEVPSVSVLVVEAGSTPPVLFNIPGICRSFSGSELDWKYRTVPQKHAARASVDREMFWPSGKTLGGSSVISGGIYERSNYKIYDEWAAQGATGWSAREVFPYLLKLEDNRDPDFVANGYHATGGPVTAERPGYVSELKGPILEAASQFGLHPIDTNAAQQTGLSDYQGNFKDGQKCNTAEVYLVPAENRTNLDILANAHVTKILMNGPQAVGIQVDYGGSSYTIRAKREVIVSAGTVNTPKLLMLSGIGPKEHLQSLKIPVVADLPVGNNFQDHSATIHPYLLDPSYQTAEQKLTNLVYIEEYLTNRTGPLSSIQFYSSIAFLPTVNDDPSEDLPSQQLIISEFSFSNKGQLNLDPEVYEKYFTPYEGQPTFICISTAIRPRSRGTVRLNSTNPYDMPLIDPNYLADPKDVEDIADGLKDCHIIATSEPMKRLGAKPFDTKFPGCEQFPQNEYSYFKCLAKSLNFAFPHGVGTSKMGDPNDPTTVVDPQLRVKGVKGLRVVDASVMPIVPNANPYVTVVMIAEKAADMIKETIDCPTCSVDF